MDKEAYQELRQMVEGTISQMGLVFEVMTSDKFANSMARMYRKMYSALVAEGFKADEALQILTNMDLGKAK